MLENLRIKNYRILKNLTFDRFSNVNLLVGQNSVGKTTVLEAINLFSRLGSPLFMEKLLGMRDDMLNSHGSEGSLRLPVEQLFNGRKFSDSESGNEIYIGSFSGKESLEIRRIYYIKSDVSINDLSLDKKSDLKKLLSRLEDKEIGLTLPEKLTGDERQKLKIISKNSLLSKPSIAKRFTPKGTLIVNLYFDNYEKDDYGRAEAKLTQDTPIEYPVKYVPTGIIPLEDLAETWDKITLTSDEQIVIDAINLIKNVSIEKLNFRSNAYNNKRIPIVKLASTNTPIPLKNLGEGIARILQLILSLLQVKGGFLLIDEFENGLHYSIQSKVWELLFRLSTELNIQVFATSHSKDTIENFSKVWSKFETNGSFYRLSLKETVRAISYSCEDFRDAINSDIEVR
jgi:AAA15 family ATPase/GTPase